MAKRYPAPPKLLLFMISAIISAFALVYGTNLGWLSVHMMYLYAFFIVYYFTICKGDKVACCYTLAGAVSSSIFLLSIKYLNNILGAMIGVITAYFVTFVTDLIVKSDWRYFSLDDFNLSSFPIERSIQFKFDQHVPVSDVPPVPKIESSKQDFDVKSEKSKKRPEKTPLSRKEKKAEIKKQKKRSE